MAARIRALQADITTLEVDAVVNAANEHLAHDGGLAAAIVGAGGRVIQEESDAWVRGHGPLTPGTAAVTSAGEMPSRLVIHVAGPRYQGIPDDERLLRTAVRAALSTAAENESRSVAMPAISAGIFGYPLDEATAVIADEGRRWVEENPLPDEILLVGYDEEAAGAFARALEGESGS